MTSSYMELRKDLDNKDKELAEKTEYFAKLNSTLSKVKGYGEELAKVESAFPEDPDIAVPNLFNFMIEISSENGLILKGVTGDIKSLKLGELGLEEFPFSVSVSGSYADFKNFLSALHKNVRMINVETMRFSSGETRETIFDFSVSLITYLDTGSLGGAQYEGADESSKSARER